MIDTNFIIKYTNGLYSVPIEYCPTYEEFRDMFSSGQLYSKQWAVDELKKTGIVNNQSLIVVGCWFGTLGVMLKDKFPEIQLSLLDIDKRCTVFLETMGYFSIAKDMYEHSYTEDIVVNTSCEHISNVREWLDLLYEGTLVLLQSNNFTEGKDHLSCVSSLNEFEKQTSLNKVLYTGEFVTPMYTRYMIIGYV